MQVRKLLIIGLSADSGKHNAAAYRIFCKFHNNGWVTVLP